VAAVEARRVEQIDLHGTSETEAAIVPDRWAGGAIRARLSNSITSPCGTLTLLEPAFVPNRAMRKPVKIPTHSPRAEGRVFNEDDRWYVRTREGMRGPFGSRRAAEAEAELFVDTLKFLEQNQRSVPPGIDPDDIT